MNPATFAHFLVYSLISLYASRVVYLIGERVWVAIRRRFEFAAIQQGFEEDKDRGFLAEHNALQKLGPHFDMPLLVETVRAEMFPKRSAFVEPDPDYRPFMNDAEEYETTPNRAA